MPVINISIENKIAEADGTLYVCDNSDFVAKFAFDAEWEAYENKTARFCYNNSYVDVVFTGNECPVPIISGTYFFNIGVYAGNLRTTTPARVPCKKSILCGSESESSASQEVRNEFLDVLDKRTGDLADLTTEAKDTLVAAINEVARSSGSESMDLRVADGYIQYSTDSGSTWTSLIAVAELKGDKGNPGTPGAAGAPGKDGAGMDITGATVGQIAKITAVDTDGKPTAWEPVDMPSGGGGRVFGTYDYTVLASGTIPAGTVTAEGLGTSYFDTGVTVGDLRGYRVWACYYRCDAANQSYGFALASSVLQRRLMYSTSNAQQIVAIWADDDGQAVIPIGGSGNVYCTDPPDAAYIGGLTRRGLISKGGGATIESFGAFVGAADSDHIYVGIFHLGNQETNAKDMRWAITGVVKK